MRYMLGFHYTVNNGTYYSSALEKSCTRESATGYYAQCLDSYTHWIYSMGVTEISGALQRGYIEGFGAPDQSGGQHQRKRLSLEGRTK